MAEPRRILLVNLWLESGGTERQLTEIAKRLDRARFEPHVACLRLQGMRLADLREAGVPLAEFPVSGFFRPSHARAWLAFGAYLRRHRIEIVHAFDVPGVLFGVPAARWYRTPLVLSSQRAFRSLTPDKRPLLRITDRLAHGIVVNSHAVGAGLIAQDRVPPEKIHYCPNGVDTTQFHPPDSRPSGAPQVGIVAMLRPEKNIETLLDAFAAARTAANGARLVIVGGGECEPMLRRRAASLNLEDACRFEPPARDVAARLHTFDIFVLPSLSEASSNSLMEAMACGCCVIASRAGGNPELVEDEISGLLFQPGDAAGLALHLRRCLAGAELRARLGQAAAQRIRERFSPSAAVERMAAIYDSLFEKIVRTART
jgi:glycosyltransferase involved in cell wall biosynthesis